MSDYAAPKLQRVKTDALLAVARPHLQSLLQLHGIPAGLEGCVVGDGVRHHLAASCAHGLQECQTLQAGPCSMWTGSACT